MKNRLNIYDGPTFQYFYFGVVCSVISILFIVFEKLMLLGIIALPFSLFTFFSIRGSSIDFENGRIKNYLNIVFIKVGNWQSLKKFTRIELLLNSQSQTMNYRSVSNTTRVRSFYISLTNNKKERIELKEFTDYKKAKKLLLLLGSKLNCEIVNRKELLESRNRKN